MAPLPVKLCANRRTPGKRGDPRTRERRFIEPNRQLKERAFERLRDAIVRGEILPGTDLSERTLAARLAMSKTPIRVALERLSREGFVDIVPQSGVRVRRITNRELAEHFGVREALELWVIRQLSRGVTAAGLQSLEAQIANQQQAIDRGDGIAYVEQDAFFHHTLASLAGNNEVLRAIQSQRDHLYRILARTLSGNAARLSQSLSEHEAVIDAIRAGDEDRAAASMQRHLANAAAAAGLTNDGRDREG